MELSPIWPYAFPQSQVKRYKKIQVIPRAQADNNRTNIDTINNKKNQKFHKISENEFLSTEWKSGK